MVSIRASSLPIVSQCAAAALAPEVRIEGSDEPARLGSAFHKCMESVVRGQPFEADVIASRFNIDVEKLRPMIGWASKTWASVLAPLFPNPIVETQLSIVGEMLTLSGHPDVLSLVDIEVRGCDYKSGWTETVAWEQQKAYALAGLQRWPQATLARMSVFRIRQQRIETEVWTRAELEAWWEWLKEHTTNTHVYRPGKHCGYCPRALECEGHLKATRALAAMLPGINLNALENYDPKELATVVEVARRLKDCADKFVKAAYAHVTANGGDIGTLFMKPVETKSISVTRGWDVLRETFGDDNVFNLLSLPKTAAEKAVMEITPRGQKGKAAKQFIDRLNEVGAIEVTTNYRLEVRRDGSYSNETESPGELAAATGDGAGVDG